MRYRLAPSFALVVFVFSVVLLVAVGILYLAGDVPASATSLHLTEADWRTEDTPGFRPPPPTLEGGAVPPAWQRVALPTVLPPQADAASSARSITWLKLAVPARPAAAGPIALYGIRVKTDGTIAVYVNGRLVHRAQEQGALWNSLLTPLWVVLDNGTGDTPVREIVVRLEHSSQTPVGLSSLWVGPVEALRGRYYMRQGLQRELPATSSAAFLAVGVFALLVWLKRRNESGYLLFFNIAAISFVAHLHYYLAIPIADDGFAWLTINSLFWVMAVVHFFFRQMHGRPLVWFTRIVVGVTGLISVLTLPDLLGAEPNTPVVTPVIYALLILMSMSIVLVGGVCSWGRSKEGFLVAAGAGFCILLGVPDWLLHNNFVSQESWFLGAYTNAVTFGTFGLLMYRRYVNAIGEVERANANLAERLQAREAELERSHQRLRAAELRQTISDERQRLMQDMHDGLGSSLISAIRSVERGGMSETRVSQVLKDCLDDLKLTIDSMEPVEADLLLLLATLRFRLEPRLEGTGIALLWEVQELPTLVWLDPSSALHILRIVQESIANILRHTRATEIRVATALEGETVQVTIQDNGQGFDVEKTLGTAAGRGLHNQQRRAQVIDGTVCWRSGPTGTRFTLSLPLERRALVTKKPANSAASTRTGATY